VISIFGIPNCLQISCQFKHSSQVINSYLLRCHLHQSFLMLSYMLPQLLPFKVWVGRVPKTFSWGFTKNSRPIMIPPFFTESHCFTLRSTRSLVLETKAYLHRRPAYNPETFPHCPRWKRCCWLESFGAVHMSMTHHVTVAISVFVISLLTALHVHFLLTFFEVLKLVGAHRRNPT
jgi:hypothetical protein